MACHSTVFLKVQVASTKFTKSLPVPDSSSVGNFLIETLYATLHAKCVLPSNINTITLHFKIVAMAMLSMLKCQKCKTKPLIYFWVSPWYKNNLNTMVDCGRGYKTWTGFCTKYISDPYAYICMPVYHAAANHIKAQLHSCE